MEQRTLRHFKALGIGSVFVGFCGVLIGIVIGIGWGLAALFKYNWLWGLYILGVPLSLLMLWALGKKILEDDRKWDIPNHKIPNYKIPGK